MTKESFIRKWLGNHDFEYTEENRDKMRDDLFAVDAYSSASNNGKPLVSGSVCFSCKNKLDDKDIAVGMCYECNTPIKQTDH